MEHPMGYAKVQEMASGSVPKKWSDWKRPRFVAQIVVVANLLRHYSTRPQPKQ